jgi:hypothetical protein
VDVALTSCGSCQELVDAKACRCPHCDATLRVCRSGPSNRPLAAALLALTLAGCPKTDTDDTDTDTDPPTDTGVQPDYGVAVNDLYDDEGAG